MGPRLLWCDLPEELLAIIKNFLLDSPSDISCFRSVCSSSWRSSTPPFKMSLQFPEVLSCEFHKYRYLKQRIIYRIEPLITQTISSSPCSWVFLVEFSGDKLYFIDPMSGFKIERVRHPHLAKVIQLCDFRITELQKVYVAESRMFDAGGEDKRIGIFNNRAKKVVILSSTKYYDGTLLAVLSMYLCVAFYKLEKDQWIDLEKNVTLLTDIEQYKGRLWGVDNMGKTVVFNSSLEVVEISPAIAPDVCYLHFFFAESRGDLFLVEQVGKHMFDEGYISFTAGRCDRLHKLHVEEKRWEEVNRLYNRVLFISDYFPWSFWLSSRKEDSIVIPSWFDRFDEGSCPNSFYYNLKTGKRKTLKRSPEFSKLFWPIPKWLIDGDTSN